MAKYKPKGARGRAMVKKLGRNYKTGNFKKIEKKVYKEYRNKGYSAKRARSIAKKTAGKIFWKKAKK